jgi:hypothetical protein
MNNNIVKGYKGIMDLDLNLVPKAFHKETVEQHLKDIDEYRLEQAKLPLRMRYENTVLKAEKLRKIDALAIKQRNKEEYDKKTKQYEQYARDYEKTHKDRKNS